MFAKLKLAAAAVAALVALAPLPASAKTTVHVGVGGGWGYPGWGYGHNCWNWNHGRCGWGYRPYYPPVVNYYYNPYPYYPAYGYGYPPPPAASYRVSCGQAKSIVYRSGYGHVSIVDCGGKYHVFNATRHGYYYRLRVNAWNGGLVVIARN